jgi:hypothetical protein
VRIRNALPILLLAFPLTAFSQTTLNFPRAFTPADLASTGFTVLNPGTTSAAVTFTMYGANGAVVGQCVLPCSKTAALSSPGQFAALGTELFPAASQAGWVQVTSPTNGLQGFWLGGDFATFTDGADSAQTSSDLIFPLVTEKTELNIANTGTGTNGVTIRLFGEAGTELAAAVTNTIAAKGVLQSQVSALFPTANLNNARYVRVTGGPGLAGTAVISGFLVDEWGVTNAVSVAGATTEANFPHVVSGVGGGGNYTTVVGVANLASSAQTVSITFTPDTGGTPNTITRTIAANGSLRDTAQNLFNPSSFLNGWVKVTGSAPLTAFIAYADSVAGGLTVVPVQTTPRSTLMFAHIADVSPWWTGLGMLNTSSSDATVNVYAMNTNGTLVGGADNVATARFTIKTGAKVAKLLTELIPQSELRGENGGFIFVTSTQPLYGIELFFLRNLRIVANVAAGSGIGFTAPPPVVLTSIAPIKATAGATITLTGSGFSTTAANNTVLFTSVSGMVSGTVTAATPTSLTVDVPQGAISGPVSVRVGSVISASVIFEVLTSTSGSSGSSGTPFPVTSGTMATSMDIVVPPPAGSLNITVIGIGDPGTAINFSGASVEISRGQTKQLVLGAAGLSEANGSTVSISGSGVTVGAVTFQSGYMRANITVSSSAISGPRDVIVTNSDMDTSIFSGGLFIR